MSGVFQPYRYPYETVAASQTAQVLGGTGATGDYLHRLIVTVSTSLTGTVTILDNATSIAIVPANTPVGVYSIEMNMRSSSGAWKVTTGAGASVVAVGIFSA
jgi:ABC-type thiamine transport system ATPase subunit